MDILNRYLHGLLFTRVEDKENFAIYAAGIAGDLGGGKRRYILLFVPQHLAIKKQARVDELPWQNLQSRTITYGYNMKKQYWNPPRDLPNFPFYLRSRNIKFSEYGIPEFPFEVLVLHDPKKKSKYQYYDKMDLFSILSTFSSVFNYVGKSAPINFTSGPSELPLPVNVPSNFNVFNPSSWVAPGQQKTNSDFDLL